MATVSRTCVCHPVFFFQCTYNCVEPCSVINWLYICPGGQGSAAPKYELPLGQYTFYYLELALEKKLARKLDDLRRSLLKTKGTIKYDSSLPGTRYISSLAEFQEWQEKMGGDDYPRDDHRRRYEGPRELREVCLKHRHLLSSKYPTTY